MIKVMIADDQTILAEGIKSVLETSDQIEVIALVSDGAEAIRKIAENKPDVVLLDIRMPNMNGVVATKEIKTRWPEIKVIILTTFDDSDYILNAINYGASGYLLKDINAESLIGAVKNAMSGDLILPSKIAKKIASAAKMVSSDKEIKLKKKFNLSDREVEIALMVYDNFNNRQISSALKISEGTTRNYISAIYVKLNAESRTQAIAIMEKAFQ
ncbi:MAG: response regulator transcription factor [Firmicutes bacterium]|jgi:response regulator receiver domain protein|nr:response regulator transcription factor [Bacillota bacterium]